MLTLQHASSPAISLFSLPKQKEISQSLLETLSPMSDKQPFDPVYLDDLLPTDARQRYHFIQTLKSTGCPTEAILYTHNTGNNKGNHHFIWLIPSDGDADEVQSRNASVVHELNAKIPQFHSREMRRSFFSLVWKYSQCQASILARNVSSVDGRHLCCFM